MPRYWTDILDHGDDPGRFTLVRGDGLIVTANEDGSIICTRKCHSPSGVVSGIIREDKVRILNPGKQGDLLKKILANLGEPIVEKNKVEVSRPPQPQRPPLTAKLEKTLIDYAKEQYPQGDNYSVRKSRAGNYVIRISNDYPLQHGPEGEILLTPDQVKKIKNHA